MRIGNVAFTSKLKVLENSNMKAFADHKIKIGMRELKFSNREENVEKGGNYFLQAISPFPTMF